MPDISDIFKLLDWILRLIGVGALLKVALEKWLGYKLERKQILFKKLQEKRGVVIEEIYKKINRAVREFNSLLKPFQEAGELPQNEKAKLVAEKANDFVDYYTDHRIFFSKELANKIDEFEKGLKEIFIDFKYSEREDKKKWEIRLAAWKKLTGKIDPLKEEIEDEFRKLIGVE